MSVNFCQFYNNTGNGYESAVNNWVSNCIMFNNSGKGTWSGGGFYNCISYGNTSEQLGVYADMNIINCTVDGEGSSLGVSSVDQRSLIVNSIIYNCTTGISADTGANAWTTSRNNIFYANATDRDADWDSHASEISGDPLFVGEGDLVEGSDGNTYKCILDIASSVDATHKPITGTDWSTYFRLFYTGGGLGSAWQTGVAYTGDTNDYRLGAGSPALAAGIDVGEVTNSASFIDIGAHQRQQATQIVGLELT